MSANEDLHKDLNAIFNDHFERNDSPVPQFMKMFQEEQKSKNQKMVSDTILK